MFGCLYVDHFFVMGIHDSFPKTAGEVGGYFLIYPFYYFNLLHIHLDISRFISEETSSLGIAGSRTQTGFLTQVANH